MAGKSSTTRFVNYKVDDVQVEGTYTIANTSGAGARQFTIEVQAGKLTRPNGNYTKWTSHRVINQAEGLNTPDVFVDDVFSVTGNSSGEIKTAYFATSWVASITEPLQKRFACQWISKGNVKLVRDKSGVNSEWVSVLNFGGGACDNIATLTVNGTEHQIMLY